MTTYKQELTLFGGWAKAQIPPPIEIGVDKPSVMPSVSISISCLADSEQEKEIEQLSDLRWVCLPSRKIEPGYDIFDGLNRRVLTILFDPSRLYETKEDSTRPTHTRWMSIFGDTWIHRAFTRFFEIWGKGTSDDLRRGTKAKPKLERSFAGLLGNQNNKSIIKSPSGEWYLKERSRLYPSIRRLPQVGIEHARQRARLLSYQKRQQEVKQEVQQRTYYKGYEMNILQARWAVFLDALSISWEYQKKRFHLDGAGWYLPSFWLSQYGCWLEVGPECLSHSTQAQAVSEQTGQVVLVFHDCQPILLLTFYLVNGGPPVESYFLNYGRCCVPDDDDKDMMAFGICPACREVTIGYLGSHWIHCEEKFEIYRGSCHGPTLNGSEGTSEVDHLRILSAFAAARHERFEHKKKS